MTMRRSGSPRSPRRPSTAAPRPGDPIRAARARGREVAIAIGGRRTTIALSDALAALVADAIDAAAKGRRIGLAVDPEAEPRRGRGSPPPCPYLILDRPPDEELTTQEAARALRVSRPTIIKAIEEGRLPARKVGKHRRIRIYDFNAFAHQQQNRIRSAIESDRLEQALGLYSLALPAEPNGPSPEGSRCSDRSSVARSCVPATRIRSTKSGSQRTASRDGGR